MDCGYSRCLLMRLGCLKKPLICGSFCLLKLSKSPNGGADAVDVAGVELAYGDASRRRAPINF